MNTAQLSIFCDGASRGNPGRASYGVVAFADMPDASLASYKANPKIAVFALSQAIGTRTNNEAEYAGMIAALQKCLEIKATTPIIYSDSELVIKQLNGQYKVKDAKLKNLFGEAQALIANVKPTLKHIRREQNQIADYLANLALDTDA
jgi:ribonuclease HI